MQLLNASQGDSPHKNHPAVVELFVLATIPVLDKRADDVRMTHSSTLEPMDLKVLGSEWLSQRLRSWYEACATLRLEKWPVEMDSADVEIVKWEVPLDQLACQQFLSCRKVPSVE